MDANNNATYLRNEIDDLYRILSEERQISDPYKRNYAKFWKTVKEINYLFKTLKPLSQEDRKKLWEYFSGLCISVKEESESSAKSHTQISLNRYEEINYYLTNAWLLVDSILHYPSIKELVESGQNLKRAGELLHDYKNEMLPEHKQDIFKKMQEIRNIQEEWWEKVRERRVQNRLKFESHVKENLEKNYDRHRSATDALHRIQSNADELRSKIASAWNDEWAERASGWLAEDEDKIRDIEKYIEQIEAWIDEDERKLHG